MSDTYEAPIIQPPTFDKLKELAEKFGLELTEKDLKDHQIHMTDALKSYNIMCKYPEPILPVKYPRTPGYRPSPEENKFNAWYWKTDIKGAAEGKLAGKRIAVKDNIPVAGVPMMNGSRIMEGYVPEFDATVITRILDAGGHIVGKAVCENLCYSGSSFTSATGPVLNPNDTTKVTGGSSSGSAALVKAGEVDMALGGDQGGSIRLPACWTGIVGHKPTWGLVPYTGIGILEPSIDHVGPMASTVYDCALLLEVIAGYDGGLDARQDASYAPPKYTELLDGKLNGIRIGILKEGFDGCDETIGSRIRSAATLLTEAGATVEETSVPMHNDGLHIWAPVCMEGTYNNTLSEAGCGSGQKGFYPTSMIRALRRGLLTHPNDLSVTMKNILLLGEYIKEKHGLEYYARAQNVSRLLRQAYDKALEEFDVLIMPTIKEKVSSLPKTGSSVDAQMTNALDMVANTVQFDITGHPALSVNVRIPSEHGMMIVGRRYDDATVLRVGHAYEQLPSKLL